MSQAFDSIKQLDKEMRCNFLIPFEEMYQKKISRPEMLSKPKTYLENI